MAKSPTPPRSSGVKPARRALWRSLLLVVGGGLLVLWSPLTVGALALSAIVSTPPAGTGSLFFGAVMALAIGVVVPVLLALRFTRLDKVAGDPTLRTRWRILAMWSLFLTVATMALAPQATRDALEAHGDWPARWLGDATAKSFGGLVRTLASAIPRSTPPAPGKVPPSSAATSDGGVAGTTGDGGTATARTDGGAAVASNPIKPSASDGGVIAPAASSASVPDHDVTPQEIFRLRAPTVVVVNSRIKSDGKPSQILSASGFLVEGGVGLVVTTEHVVRGAGSVEVRLRDGRALTPVTVLVVDRARDLALLQVRADGLSAAPLAVESGLAMGQRVVAIGADAITDFSVIDGIVSAQREIDGAQFLQIQTTAPPGPSGTALFDARGRIVGALAGGAGGGLHLALHLRHIAALLKQPRAPIALLPFAPVAKASGLSLEGVEGSAAEKLKLAVAATAIATALDPCLEGAPVSSHLALAWEPKSRRERLTSDLGKEGERCFGAALGPLIPTMVFNLLADEHRDLGAGTPISLHFRVDAGTRSVDVRLSTTVGEAAAQGAARRPERGQSAKTATGKK